MKELGYMTCDACGFVYNTTLKFACGGAGEEGWQPTDDTLNHVPSGEIAHLSLAKKLKYIELFGGKAPDELKEVHSAFGVAKPSEVIVGKPATKLNPSDYSDHPEDDKGVFNIVLNMTENNSDTMGFPADGKGNAIVPYHVLQKCAENLNRLRSQRNDIRKQWQELQREHMATLGANPVEIRRSAIKGIMQKWDRFVARRRTIWDEPGLSARQRAQRVRRCNEESTAIMAELLNAVMSGQLEELPVDPSEVGAE